MTRSVYVASSSDEIPRARRAMAAVRALGWRVALDWPALIDNEGGVANPTSVARGRRAAWAQMSVLAVRSADAVWLLTPTVGHARGAFCELGVALATGLPVVASGPVSSIFPALATAEVATDEEALPVLRGWFEP